MLSSTNNENIIACSDHNITRKRSAVTMPVREGQRLGNYRLHRLLGKGSFAEVYLGEHLYLRNYAAIKILHTSLNEKDEQSFLSEAQTIAQLTHPNIVHVR